MPSSRAQRAEDRRSAPGASISSSAAKGSSISSSLGLRRQGAGDGDAHLHAAGQFARDRRARNPAGPAAPERAAARVIGFARAACASGPAAGAHWSSASAQGIRVGSWNTKPISGRAPRQSIVAAVGRDQARDQAQRGGFAATAGAQQRDEFAFATSKAQARKAPRCRCRSACRLPFSARRLIGNSAACGA